MYGAPMSFAYHAYEAVHMMVSPARGLSDAMHTRLQESRQSADLHAASGAPWRPPASCSSATTRRYGKPDFGIAVDHDRRRQTVAGRRAGRLGAPLLPARSISTARSSGRRKPQPKLLIVAPMSGHYATLLRGTVEALLPGSRRLHHRLDRCAHGAARRPAASTSTTTSTTSSRCCTSLGAGHACHGGVPAVGAGARGGRA